MNRVESFWSKVDMSGDCWVWTAAQSGGRGRVAWGGRSRLAARVAYELAHPEVDVAGRVIRHACDNPICVRPEHLDIGTHADNVRDAQERGRNARGERHGQHKLSALEVESLRRDRAAGATLQSLAETYGISLAEVSLVARGLKWPDAGGPIAPKDPRWRDE